MDSTEGTIAMILIAVALVGGTILGSSSAKINTTNDARLCNKLLTGVSTGDSTSIFIKNPNCINFVPKKGE
jgi:phosphotransacetylase